MGTRVRCCRKTWGYVKCGTTVHYKGCGWQGGGGYPSWYVPSNGWRRSSFCTARGVGFFCYQHHKVATLRGTAAQAQATAHELNNTLSFPDESTGFDEPGPYLEEPSEEHSEQPPRAKEGWDNVTALQQSVGDIVALLICVELASFFIVAVCIGILPCILVQGFACSARVAALGLRVSRSL